MCGLYLVIEVGISKVVSTNRAVGKLAEDSVFLTNEVTILAVTGAGMALPNIEQTAT